MADIPVSGASAPAQARSVGARATPLIVASALLMENLDSTVLSTSLPQIALDLGTSPIRLKLALTSYLLALAVFIPASGWAADRFGAKRVFLAAIAVFALGSIACASSSSLGELVAARVLQGIGGSMMVPVARLIVLRATPKEGLVGALAWFTVPAMIGPIMGPPLGGFVTTYFDWRWIFWINVPIAALGLALTLRFIPDLREERVRPFDFRGFLLAGPGLAACLTGLTMSGLGVEIGAALALTLGGAALVALYVRHALRAPAPLVDLRLLQLPTFRIAAIGGSLFRVGVGAIPFLLPLLLQTGFGLSAFESGLLTFAAGAGAVLMKFLAQPILRRFGFRRALVVNALLAALSLLAPASFTVETPHALIFAALFLGGVSRSLEFTAINAIGYAEVEPARMGSATSFTSVLQQLSLSLGITVAAFGLEAMAVLGGGPALEAGHFAPVFVAVAAVAACSAIWFARLTEASGAALLGRARAE